MRSGVASGVALTIEPVWHWLCQCLREAGRRPALARPVGGCCSILDNSKVGDAAPGAPTHPPGGYHGLRFSLTFVFPSESIQFPSGVALPKRIFVVSEEAAEALRQAAVRFMVLSDATHTLRDEGVTAGERI